MSRITGSPLLAFVIAGTLTACAPTAVDPDEINDWRVTQEAASSDDQTVLAALSANVSAGQVSEPDSPGEMKVDFELPATVRRIEFACFGGGTVRAAGDAQAGTDSFTANLGTFDCAQSPHQIDVSLFGGGPLDSFAFVADESSQDSAWYVIVAR